MRKLFFTLAISIIGLLLQGCLKDKILRTYSIFTPVYKSKIEVYANIKTNPAQAIENPGKIYLYGNYIFLNDIDKGVHIIDNTNPSAPQVKGFINIPGNLDIAVKGNTLYADLYKDMVVVDITNPMQARFDKFIPNIFPARTYSNGFIADSNRVIVDWIKKDTTVNVNDEYKFFQCATCSFVALDIRLLSNSSAGALAATPTTGIGGSMARFTLVNDYLYAVNHANLLSFNVTNTNNPVLSSNQNLGWGIETIYPFNNRLFIGSMTGMFIFDLANPATPVKLSSVQHFLACDPVIADGNFAYVTLRTGTNCARGMNVFNVYDISNPSAPSLLCSKNMTNPHGLAKSGNLIFICDGKDGLKIYDASTSACNMPLVKHFTSIETYDAIAWNNNLLVVAKDGLYQYDYANPQAIAQRSKLSVNR